VMNKNRRRVRAGRNYVSPARMTIVGGAGFLVAVCRDRKKREKGVWPGGCRTEEKKEGRGLVSVGGECSCGCRIRDRARRVTKVKAAEHRGVWEVAAGRILREGDGNRGRWWWGVFWVHRRREEGGEGAWGRRQWWCVWDGDEVVCTNEGDAMLRLTQIKRD
jgi:hypothetical protein